MFLVVHKACLAFLVSLEVLDLLFYGLFGTAVFGQKQPFVQYSIYFIALLPIKWLFGLKTVALPMILRVLGQRCESSV